ncbi:MAG: archaellin/type IV pilin N-terminal domain-containing protein [Candidatus Woesearchaeota archaeon]
MDKKGISPLIATVLIIGFTVALAALIITWGGQFIRQTQSQVGQETDLQVLCSQVKFDITGVSCTGTLPEGLGDIDTISVVSQGNQQIEDFTVRVTGVCADDGNPTTDCTANLEDVWVDDNIALTTPPLIRFGAGEMDDGSLDEIENNLKEVRLIELIAIVADDAGRRMTCEAGIEEYIPATGVCGYTG